MTPATSGWDDDSFRSAAIYPDEPKQSLEAAAAMAHAAEEPEPPSEFAYESDLRDFLAKHLSLREPGFACIRRRA